MSLRDYIRGYVDCRNDNDNKYTKVVYNALKECVGLDCGKYDYNRFNHALNMLDKGEEQDKVTSAAFTQFKTYLIEHKEEINKLWNGKDRVESWLERIYDVAKYLKDEKTVDKDIERILDMSKSAYIETDKISGKQYLKIDKNTLRSIFYQSGHYVEEKDKNGNPIPKEKQEDKYYSEVYKLNAYSDYCYQVYNSHPEIFEKLMKEGNLAELNMVFNNRIDIDYANKTSCFSNCDRYFGPGIKEAGILTTLMIAYQDVNERLTMLLLNKTYQLDLIMNPNAAHDSKINGHSGADADFQEKDTKNFLELQTKQLKMNKYDEYDPGKLIYKMTKHKSFVKYIEDGKQVYHMEKAQNSQKSVCVDGKYVGRNSKYLQEHYTIYDMNAILTEFKKHPECEIKDEKYAGYNAMAINVAKLEEITGKTLKFEIDKIQEEYREFQELINGFMEKAIRLNEKSQLKEHSVFDTKTPNNLDSIIKVAINKKEHSETKLPKKTKEKER